MKEDEFPIGSNLKEISVVEYKGYGDNEFCLERVQLTFETKSIILQPISDTDEIEIVSFTHSGLAIEIAKITPDLDTPVWCNSFIGEKLQTVWVCENSQGYQDQVIFGFKNLRPSIAFVAEGSVILAFCYEQILQEKVSAISLKIN